MRYWVGAFACSLAVVCWLIFFPTTSPALRPYLVVAAASDRVQSQVPRPPESEFPIVERDQAARSVAAPGPSARLQLEFAKARDWRLFAFSAFKAPREGGYYYAAFVAQACQRDIARSDAYAMQRLQESVAATGTLSGRQAEIGKRFSEKCASFAEGEAKELERLANENAKDRTDPLMNARLAFERAGTDHDVDALRAVVPDLIATQDPLLLSRDSLLARVMIASLGQAPGGDAPFVFDGDMPASSLNDIGVAADLALCLPGTVCTLDDNMQIECLRGEDCSQSHHDWIRNRYLASGGTSAEFDKVEAMAERVRSALDAGRAAAFLPTH